MFSPQVLQIAVIALAAISVGLIVFVVVFPHLSGEKKAQKRRNLVASQNSSKRAAMNASQNEVNARRKNVHDSLKEIERKQKARNKVTMKMRLVRAGLDLEPSMFYIISVVGGLSLGLFSWLMGAMPMIAAALAFVGVLGLPRWVLKKITQRRQKKFINEFANCIDVIVRGVKTGLPLNECLDIIAREAPEPVRTEFQELVEQQRVGVPLSECFQRMMQRMPLPEVNFFAIVVAIQSKAGGNLSEALGNLSDVLRARKGLAAKVRAMSSEAKASAGILGSLPFGVMFLVHLSSPDYIVLLFEDRTGNLLLVGAGFWMTCGLLVMRKMINFKY